VVFGWLLGMALACEIENRDCDDYACGDCRMCATQSRHACRDQWRACDLDPSCAALDECMIECFALEGAASVGCEHDCRGSLALGTTLYDPAMQCLDDVCRVACD